MSCCPGYVAPAGFPLVVQLGTGTTPPAVTAHALERDGVALEHCVFDETSYANPDPTRQALARSVLAARNAVVVLPAGRSRRAVTRRR